MEPADAAAAVARPSGSMLDRLVEYLPDPALVTDGNIVVAANDLAATLVGCELSVLTGSCLDDLVPSDRLDTFRSIVAEQRRCPDHLRFDASSTTLRRADGTIVHVDVSIRPVETDAGWRWITTLHEADQRVQAERRLASRDAILQAVAYASGRLLRGDDWEAGLDDVLARLGRAADVSRVYVFEVAETPDDAIARHRFEWAAPGIEPQIDNPRLQTAALRAAGFGRWIDVLRAGNIIQGDIRTFPEREREVQESHGVRTLVVVPIVVEGRWWGFIGFDECVRLRSWSPAEVQALRSAADVIGASIERWAATSALARSRELYAAAYERERDAAARLRQLDDLKERFLEAMSHELRTPLAAIIGFTETLQRLDLAQDDRQTELIIARLRRNADRLDALLGDLLDVAQLTHRGLDVDPSQTEIEGVVRLALTETRASLGERNVELDVRVDRAELDAPKLRRIVTCLLRNVARHTPPQTGARVVVDAVEEGMLEVIVEDDGPGIADTDKDAVLEPFVQGPAVARHAPGTGLGLALVARLARLHGGDVLVEDAPGGGTRIRVQLATGAAVRQVVA